MPVNTLIHICDRLDPRILYETVFTQFAVEEAWTFSMRPVYVPKDAMILDNWARNSPENQPSEQSILTTALLSYGSTLLSTSSQPFLCFINDEPILLVEVRNSKVDEMYGVLRLSESDFILNTLWRPLKNENPRLHAKQVIFAFGCCLEFIWGYPEVEQLYFRSPSSLTLSEEMADAHGFVPIHTIDGYPTTNTIFLLKRAMGSRLPNKGND